MKKTIISLISAVIILVALLIVFKDEIKQDAFVVLLPLSGGNAEQGEWYKKGFEVAQKEIEDSTNRNIKIIFEDTKGILKLHCQHTRI